MSRFKHSALDSPLVYLVVLISLTLFGLRAWSTAARSNIGQRDSNSRSQKAKFADIQSLGKRLQAANVPVTNMTKSVRLVRIEKLDDRELRLTLENQYDKTINGFQMSVGNVGVHTEFMYNTEHMIPPGGIWVQQSAIQADTDTKGIAFLSVHFDDGTSDGDEVAIKQVNDARAGQLTQIRRALGLIRRTLRSGTASSVTGLQDLQSRIRALPTVQEQGRPDFASGLESGNSE
jgi:hypothetical protein